MGEKRIILFIDTGDNCRCPMAAGYFQKLLQQKNVSHIEIRTAGVMTPTGLLPTPEAVQLLQEEGVDIRRHRSRPLSLEMIRRADLVLGMTPFHVQTAFRMTEDARGKTFLLKEYVGRDGKNTQIADPMGGTLEIFKKCFNEIRASLQRMMEMEIVTVAPKATGHRAEAAASRDEAKAKAGAEKPKKEKKKEPGKAPAAKKPSRAAKSAKPAKTKAAVKAKTKLKVKAKAKPKPLAKAAKAKAVRRAKPAAKPKPKPKSPPRRKPAPSKKKAVPKKAASKSKKGKK